MRRLIFFVFILIATTAINAFAAVFVVTSNADAGLGTLREVLTLAAANGDAEKDFIHFNLANLSEAGRTITIINLLPDVSGNLVIDGSTQPGNKFGVSSAKICLNFALLNLDPNSFYSALYISHVDNVGIYGLYVKNNTPTQKAYLTGIKLESNDQIQIGASGKGNVIFGFVSSIDAGVYDHQIRFCRNLTLQSNFIDVDVDGQTFSNGPYNGASLNGLTSYAKIGGAPSEGNIFAAGVLIYQVNRLPASEEVFVDFKNNKVGVNYTVTKSFESVGVALWTTAPGGNTHFFVEDNIITASGFFNALDIQGNAYPVKIVRNYIGVDRTLQNTLPTSNTGIYIRNSEQVFIGSNNAADANYITGCKPVYVWEASTASIRKNSFFCTVDSYPMVDIGLFRPITQIAITDVTASKVMGTATPNSAIELFYSDNCGIVCSPKTYFASTSSDINGNWEYSGVISGIVIASATINNSTSEFTNPRIHKEEIVVTGSCDGSGSIKGAQVSGANIIKWVNEQGATVGTAINLENVPPGKYKLIVSNGSCGDETEFYIVEDVGLAIDVTQMQKTNASCNQADGRITGISHTAGYQSDIIWKNASGATVGTDLNLINVPAGNYFLTITPIDKSCAKVYGPVTIINTTGPNINQSSANITATSCGQSIGSITGITANGTGTLKYSWKNEQQQEVGTTRDLVNQPAGKYTLQVTDNTQCGPVYTTQLEILELNGITLNELTMVIITSGCSNANGSITGIKAPGATVYKWTDVDNKTVGSMIDLPNVAAGDYTFTASNTFGCVKTQTYHVGQQPATVYPAYTSSVINACFSRNNGSVTVSTNALVKSARWANAQDATIGTGNAVSDLVAGTYKLYLTDANGCEGLYNSYTVTELAELKILTAQITDDECGFKTGKIENVQITGGSPPYAYSWFDEANTLVSSSSGIDNLGAGVYRLVVTDSRNCAQPFANYSISNQSSFVSAPTANDIQVCSPGKVILSVNNPSAAFKYRLYGTESSLSPLEERDDGRFTIDAKANTRYFVSQLRGMCESARTPVQITVGISALDIANTFTPNADGINDYWRITGIENSPKATVQVFSRNGQIVFNSKGYANPFNGTVNGQDLPAGSYYYIINMGSACSVLSGTITIIR